MMKMTLFVGAAAFASPVSGHSILVSDTFSLDDGTGASGAKLDGAPVEIGSGVWNATIAPATTVFSADGRIISKVNNTGMEGRIQILPAPTDIISVSASVKTGNADWVAIGFAPAALDNQQLFTAGQSSLWVLLRPTGGLTVYKNGTTGIKKGDASKLGGRFDPGAFYNLTLDYDPVNGLARVLVQDTSYNGCVIDWFPTGAIPGVGAAAFKMNVSKGGTTGGSTQFDNFRVTSATSMLGLPF